VRRASAALQFEAKSPGGPTAARTIRSQSEASSIFTIRTQSSRGPDRHPDNSKPVSPVRPFLQIEPNAGGARPRSVQFEAKLQRMARFYNSNPKSPAGPTSVRAIRSQFRGVIRFLQFEPNAGDPIRRFETSSELDAAR